nr:unnamed protein product [Digitaria exilis]
MFSSRDPCESCDCECSSDDPPPLLPPAPCEKDCCDSDCERGCCDPAREAAEEPDAPTPSVPPVLLQLQAAEVESQSNGETNGSSPSRSERGGEGRGGNWMSPRREDGDGAEVARLVDLKLHGLLLLLLPSRPMELPEWVDIVKTARFKELPPYDPDWYYTRAASIARKIYLRQGIGVGGFQKIYGGRQRNGSRPPHFCKSSGAISRNILQQLQKMGIIDVDPKGGRLITSQGRRDLDQVAGRVAVEA